MWKTLAITTTNLVGTILLTTGCASRQRVLVLEQPAPIPMEAPVAELPPPVESVAPAPLPIVESVRVTVAKDAGRQPLQAVEDRSNLQAIANKAEGLAARGMYKEAAGMLVASATDSRIIAANPSLSENLRLQAATYLIRGANASSDQEQVDGLRSEARSLLQEIATEADVYQLNETNQRARRLLDYLTAITQ